MASRNLGARRNRKGMTPEQRVEELAQLIDDLHKLLETYAPSWYTEGLDTKILNTLAKFTLSKKTSAGGPDDKS